MNVSIDHIDEGIAVLVVQDDFRKRIQVPVSLLPPGSREGDVLTLTLESDPAATAAAKERVAGLIKKIKKQR
ncbi:MAG: DUF3006 domain-containing protein [Methanoregulaceae archaeon]|nr:DUF3006 domain-containing protein [Methanoregulaceae archaeon]